MKDETFAQGMLLLREAYPNRFGELDVKQLEAWRTILDSIPDKVFKNVVVHIIRTHKDPPQSAAVFFEVARELARPHVSGRDALEIVVKIAREKGISVDIHKEFAEDPALIRTVQTLGWRRICLAHESEWPFLENKFFQMYDDIRASQDLQADRMSLPHPEAVGALPGPVHIGKLIKLPTRTSRQPEK